SIDSPNALGVGSSATFMSGASKLVITNTKSTELVIPENFSLGSIDSGGPWGTVNVGGWDAPVRLTGSITLQNTQVFKVWNDVTLDGPISGPGRLVLDR